MTEIGAKIATLGTLYALASAKPAHETPRLAAWWVARAACVFECLGSRPAHRKALAGQARRHAEALERSSQSGGGSWTFAWKKSVAAQVDASLLDFLKSAADVLDPRDAAIAPGLLAELTSELEEWRRVEGRIDALLQLQEQLHRIGTGGERLLERMVTAMDSEAKWAAAARRSDELWHHARSVEERATATVVVRLAERLAEASEDEENWQPLHEWTTDWLAQVAAHGGIVLDLPVDRSQLLELARHPSGDRQWLRVKWSPSPRSEAAQTAQTGVAGSTFAAFPEPPVFGDVDGKQASFLAAWQRKCRSPQSALAQDGSLRNEMASWLGTPVGEEWLNGLLPAVKEDAAARIWWTGLRNKLGVAVYPDVSPETGRAAWPIGSPLPWPGARGVQSEQPDDQIVEVERYTTEPARTRFTVSDGPTESAAAKAFSAVVHKADTRRSELIADGVWETARRLSLHPPDEWDERSVNPLLTILDRHVKQDWAGAPDGAKEEVLEAIREWAGSLELELVPERIPAEGQTRDSLGAINCDAELEHDARQPGGVIRVTQWGVRWRERVLRRGNLAVSLGPASPELLRLREAVEMTPLSTGLAAPLEELNDAILGGYLEGAAVDLYTAFYSDRLRPLRESAVGGEVAARLLAYLQQGPGLTAFCPENVMEHPSEWVNIVAGARVVTGVVRQVFRPGLKDSVGRLVVPAIVSAE